MKARQNQRLIEIAKSKIDPTGQGRFNKRMLIEAATGLCPHLADDPDCSADCVDYRAGGCGVHKHICKVSPWSPLGEGGVI